MFVGVRMWGLYLWGSGCLPIVCKYGHLSADSGLCWYLGEYLFFQDCLSWWKFEGGGMY